MSDTAPDTEPAPPFPPAAITCPVVQGQARAPVHEAEIVVDQPEHKHARVGGLEFCFRLRAGGRGWVYEGAFAVATAHLLDEGTFRASFSEARAQVTDLLAGTRRVKAPRACPECGALFPEGPEGEPPFLWECAPIHAVESRDGFRTTYEPPAIRKVVAPDEEHG